jgi:predicted Zn-dependent peptidase
VPVIEGELANGVRVICEPMEQVRSVALGLWIGVGSRDEPAELAGAAHFLEHLVFKGTERRSARDIAEFADAAGGNLNAYTTREYTCYYDKVLDEQFPDALAVLADMVGTPRLASDDFAKEQHVILDELRLVEDTPEDLVQDLFFASLWGSHPIARPVAGRTASIRRLSAQALKDFHARHYVGSRLALAVAGRVDPETVMREAERCLGGLPRGSAARGRRPPRAHAVRRLRPKRIEQVQVCIGCDAPGLRDEGFWPTLLLANLLGGGTSSRLFQSIREDRGLAYDVGAFHSACSDCGTFAVYLAAGPAAVQEAVDLALAEVERLRGGGVVADELERQKQQFRRGFWLGLEGTSSRMSRLGRAVVLGQPVLSPEQVLARMEAVDVAGLDAAAATLGDPQGWTAAAVGPGTALRALWPALVERRQGGSA